MNKRQCMTAGVPDCPECDGKGMCDEHRLEYLIYERNKAQRELNEFESELKNRKEQKCQM